MLSKQGRASMLSKFFGYTTSKYKYLLKINKLKDDPISLLIGEYSEIEEFRKILSSMKEQNLFKQLYLNTKNLLDILLEEEKILNVNYEDCKKNLSEYYYLDLLINENKYIINFAYHLDFIKKIIKDNKDNQKPLSKLINSKIVLDLIDNYINSDTYNEYNEKEEIEDIINENKIIIKNNLNNLKDDIEFELEVKKVIEMNIDDLYAEIIYILMKNKKIEDYKLVTKIFKQMNLESIDISKKVYEKCLEIFNDKKYIQKYLITSPNHLGCPKKIYHYFILFNFILKDSLYIYQIPYLSIVKKNILNIINKQLNNLNIDMSKKFKKFKNIVEKFLDCDFYKKKFNNYLENAKQEKQNITIPQIHFDRNRNEIRYDNFYPNVISRSKYLSTYITFNYAKVSNEYFQEDNKKIFENNGLPKLNAKEYLYANRTFEAHRKGKIDKNTKSKNYILIFIEEINDDKVLLEDKNFKQCIYYCLPNKKWNKMIFSDKSQKEFRINENLVVFTYNKFFEGEEDKLVIYNKTSQTKITTIKDYSFPFGLNGFTVMNNNILICPCKQDDRKGILSIYCENNKVFHLNFLETNNFKVTSICLILNDELKETNYFLIAGVDTEKTVKIHLAKLIYDYKSNKMNLSIIVANIPIKRDENFFNFEKPIYQIIQSKITRHIFIYSDKKIHHFSPPNINKYLILDKNKEYEKLLEEDAKIEKLYEEYENKLKIDDFIRSIYSSENG